MATRKAVKRENATLGHLSEICLSLPEAERRDMNEHADFRVRGKVFASGRGVGLACGWTAVQSIGPRFEISWN